MRWLAGICLGRLGVVWVRLLASVRGVSGVVWPLGGNSGCCPVRMSLWGVCGGASGICFRVSFLGHLFDKKKPKKWTTTEAHANAPLLCCGRKHWLPFQYSFSSFFHGAAPRAPLESHKIVSENAARVVRFVTHPRLPLWCCVVLILGGRGVDAARRHVSAQRKGTGFYQKGVVRLREHTW